MESLGPSSGSAASRRSAAASASGSPGGHEERALAVHQQLARGRRVGRDERRAAGERLKGLVRDHARRLRRASEDPEGGGRRVQLAGQELVVDPRDPFDVRRVVCEQRLELAAADDADPKLRREPRRRQDRLEPVQRDQLPDEEERAAAGPAGTEDPLLSADEADLDPARAELAEELRVSLGVGHDEVGRPERGAVDPGERPRGQRAAAEAAAVVDESVGEGDERVQHDRPPSRRPPRRGHVEVAGVADDQRVEGRLGPVRRELDLREREPYGRADPGRELVLAPLPHRDVPLRDLHPGPAQAGDHLGVSRIAPLVGAEVEHPHGAQAQERISSTSRSARSRSAPRSSCWLVIISLISPSEKNWSPTTTSSTPSSSSGRPPIEWPRIFSTVR